MPSPTLIKSFNAGAAVRGRRIVQFGAADYAVIEATASSQNIIGISESIDAVSGDQVDVILGGVTELLLGGTVTRGAWITSDASGAGVAAAPAAGVNANVVGRAVTAGVAGDIVPVVLAIGQIQG